MKKWVSSFVVAAFCLAPTAVFADSSSDMMSMLESMKAQMSQMQNTIEQQNMRIEQLESKIAPVALPLPKESDKSDRSPILAGMGKVEMSVLLQEWYTYTSEGTSGPSGATKDNFRNRRAELGFGGKLMDDLSWKLVADPSLVREDNTARSILKDAYVEYKAIPHHTLKLGQYKIPITEEGFRSSVKIDTVERSFIGRTFGDKRDVGVMAIGDWKYLDYQVGAFNGNESNNFDTNDQKDIVGRFVLTPFPDNSYLKGLELGTSMYHRATNETAAEKKRIGAEARYEYGPFSVKSEYIHAQDAAVPASGWYIQTGYFFLPRWQGIFRFEGFDPNERAINDKEIDITGSLNYILIYPTTKLQIQYTRRDIDGGTDDNQLLTAVQYAF